MRQSKHWLFIALIISSIGCSQGKKQTLAAEEEKDRQEEIADFSASDIFQGERKDEIRKIDPSSPPIVIDMSGTIEQKELNLTDYYPQVRFVKLQHPKSSEGEGFKIQSGMVSFQPAQDTPWPTFSSVLIHKEWILVGNLAGLYAYNLQGEYLYTLLNCIDFKDVDMASYVQIDMKASQQLLCGFSVMNNICSFTSVTDGEGTLHFFDLSKGSEIHRKAIPLNSFHLLNARQLTGINYLYDPIAKEPLPIMHTITANNDTVCSFLNHNIITDIGKMPNYHNPGSAAFYNFNERLTFRQEGNDTIFRFRSEYEINPAYVFNAGSYKATIQDIVTGKMENKRSINNIVETDKFFFFSLMRSSTRLYYDKSLAKIYEYSKINSTPEMLPLIQMVLEGNETSIYGVYPKNILTQLAGLEYSPEELSTINKWNDELKEEEILLMILEE